MEQQFDMPGLVRALQSFSTAGVPAHRVSELLQHSSISPHALAPYLYWESGRYTRNLVYRDAAFEVLVVCWSPGSVSPIHDHAGQECWLYVHQGALAVDDYALDAPGEQGRVGPNVRVHHTETLPEVGRGGLDHRSTHNAVHRVRNSSDVPCVSVHVYGRPVDACIVYDAEAATARWAQLSYHSVGGKRCAAASRGNGERPRPRAAAAAWQ